MEALLLDNRYRGSEAEQWFNGDHMIFVQKGVSSLAFTADKIPELMATVTHTPLDTPEIIDPSKLVELALALSSLSNSL
jgi:aminopeptidase YwaD